MHNKKESTLFWIYILLWAFKFFFNTFIYIKCLFWWLNIKSFIAQRKLSYHGISPQLLGGKKSNKCYLYHMCTHVSSRFFFFFLMSHLDLCVNPIEFCFWLILFSYFPNLVIGLSFFLGGNLQVIYYLLPWIVGFALPYACQISYQLMLFTIWFLNLFLCIILDYKNLKFKHVVDNIVINFWSFKNFTNIKDRKKMLYNGGFVKIYTQ